MFFPLDFFVCTRRKFCHSRLDVSSIETFNATWGILRTTAELTLNRFVRRSFKFDIYSVGSEKNEKKCWLWKMWQVNYLINSCIVSTCDTATSKKWEKCGVRKDTASLPKAVQQLMFRASEDQKNYFMLQRIYNFREIIISLCFHCSPPRFRVDSGISIQQLKTQSTFVRANRRQTLGDEKVDW